MSEREVVVHVSDLEKIADVLTVALRHHRARDEMNAALHLQTTARYSPLTSEIEAALERTVGLMTSREP